MVDRYWINDRPGPDAPEMAVCALVDESAGGEIAYFLDYDTAREVVLKLNRHENHKGDR